jgi:hypothetical protein
MVNRNLRSRFFVGLLFCMFFVGCGQTELPTKTPELQLKLSPLVIHSVNPGSVVKHGVEWRTALVDQRQNTVLNGPKWYVTEIAPDPTATEAIRFNAYELPTTPEGDPVKQHGLKVEREDGMQMSFEVQPATHFLLTSQELKEGSPAEAPANLSRFVACPIVEGQALPGETLDLQEESVTLQEPAYILIPAEEWHHDDHYPVKDSKSCWVVYAVEPKTSEGTLSTLDEMGLNSLELGDRKYVCLPARWSP